MLDTSGGQDSSTGGTSRVRGTVVVKPIVYGNVARYFGKKREEDGHTHQWTVYVRPYHNEDMSAYVKKVQFKLHDSYPNSLRLVTRPPFEVSETGWGEFDMTIRIHFVDPQEKPLVISHLLKLFQSDVDIVMGHKSLVREFYDEVLFVDPSPLLHRALKSTRPMTTSAYEHETDFEEKSKTTLASIRDLSQKISTEIVTLKEQLKQKKKAIDTARSIMDELEQETLQS